MTTVDSPRNNVGPSWRTSIAGGSHTLVRRSRTSFRPRRDSCMSQVEFPPPRRFALLRQWFKISSARLHGWRGVVQPGAPKTCAKAPMPPQRFLHTARARRYVYFDHSDDIHSAPVSPSDVLLRLSWLTLVRIERRRYCSLPCRWLGRGGTGLGGHLAVYRPISQRAARMPARGVGVQRVPAPYNRI
jgi:hypothetical protein